MNAIVNEPYIWCSPSMPQIEYRQEYVQGNHKDIGHTTKQCTKLKDKIEFLIKKGHLKEYVLGN